MDQLLLSIIVGAKGWLLRWWVWLGIVVGGAYGVAGGEVAELFELVPLHSVFPAIRSGHQVCRMRLSIGVTATVRLATAQGTDR